MHQQSHRKLAIFKLQNQKNRKITNKYPHIHHASQSRFRLDFGLDPEILGQCRLPQRPACRLLPSGLPYQQLQSAGQQCHCGVSYFSKPRYLVERHPVREGRFPYWWFFFFFFACCIIFFFFLLHLLLFTPSYNCGSLANCNSPHRLHAFATPQVMCKRRETAYKHALYKFLTLNSLHLFLSSLFPSLHYLIFPHSSIPQLSHL